VRVQGTRSFAAPRGTVWEVLNSPERMAKLMPGVESFDVHDPEHWRANVKIPLGLGGLRMSFDFTKLEERQPSSRSCMRRATASARSSAWKRRSTSRRTAAART
jgi:carbon monoxide dehydrogenase subunit G